MKQKLICIAGPTASGKTALSIALAKRLDTEIISSDSMQLYRGMDIGTAKPSMEERDGVVHHMFDVADAGETFSVAKYQQMADACAQDILSRGKVPIVCGGTGLYLDALIEGSVFSGDETNLEAREKYNAIAREQGAHALHEMLRAVDPVSAQRIHENNVKRVVRALEVYEQTGMTINEWNEKINDQSQNTMRFCLRSVLLNGRCCMTALTVVSIRWRNRDLSKRLNACGRAENSLGRRDKPLVTKSWCRIWKDERA